MDLTTVLPGFNNSCGKIFDDRLVLASANREKEIMFEDFSEIKFINSIKVKSLLWALLPSPLLVLLYLDKKIEGIVYFIIVFAVVAFTALAVIKAERNYYIVMRMADGSERSVKVSKSNNKDAQKFVEKATKKMRKYKYKKRKSAEISIA